MEIIKIKWISSLDKKGCEDSPEEILKQLNQIESKESGELIEINKLKLEEIHVNLNNSSEAEYLIFENSKEIFERNFKAIFIGGDHSISYPIVRGFKKIEENPLLIIFDANASCMELNESFNYKNWLRKLFESGFDSSKIILISSRNLHKEEIDFLKKENIAWIKMDVLQENIEEVCDLIMERARKSSGFYISIDISAVDPGFAPGSNCLEPGGMSSREIIYFIKRLVLLKNFKAGDIVGINPLLDINKITIKLGARILAEML